MSVTRAVVLIPDLANPDFMGGIQVFNNYFVRALGELGVSLTVVGVNDRPADRARTKTPLCACNAHPKLRKPLAAWHTLVRCAVGRPDLLICGHLHFTPLARMISKLTGVPFVTITHGVELWEAPQKYLDAVRDSRKILAVSRYTKRLNLEKLPGYPEDDVVIFSNTFDETRFVPMQRDTALFERMGVAPSDKVVLTVGRLADTERLKGYEEGLRAMAKVVERVPEARYVLAGKGNDLERLRSLAGEIGLGDRAVFPGFVADEDIVPLFAGSDVFVLPSRKEGFGIVFLEAMGCGTPAIGGNKDGSMDPLLDGKLGSAVDPEDVDAIAEAICEHLEGRAPAERADPTTLRERTIEHYGFGAFRDRLADLLASLGG